jgi:hypothetical protein
MVEETEYEPNIYILNSLTLLFTNAMKPEELERRILPLYAKNRVKFDINTYQMIAKMYLNSRDLDKIYELRLKAQEAGLKPNQWFI